MEKVLKFRLLVFALISAIGFTCLVLPQSAAISVPLFVVLQFVCLYFIMPKKKPLWLFVPIFLLSLNSFLSGNGMWHISNFIVIMLLYSVMILLTIDKFPIKDLSLLFISYTLECVITPIRHFGLPFKWLGEINKSNTTTAKRVLIGVGISIPCLIFLLIMLSSADAVFQKNVGMFFDVLFALINFIFIFKAIYGLLVGLYLFGLVYIAYAPKENIQTSEVKRRSGDLLILNILLFSILLIYTMFVIIQFRYLFAGGQLPYGLTFTEYARKGFFELLFLSGLNIVLILVTVMLSKEKLGLWSKITKGLCCYLCTVTIILLASSFYRMSLYSSDDGLTRLRLLVFGFLIFEALGLIITFFYILKPKFNIAAVYLIIALSYYLVINLVPIDYYIAKNQVDRYFRNEKAGIDYIVTLSTDAAPQIARLLVIDDAVIKEKAVVYFDNSDRYYNSFVPRWQRFNLSVDRARELWNEN